MPKLSHSIVFAAFASLSCAAEIDGAKLGVDDARARALDSAADPSEARSIAGASAGCSSARAGNRAQEAPAALWLRQFDDTNEVTGVASDSAGNVLVVRAEKELVKLDSEGNALWSKPFGSLVAIDGNDDVYVAGSWTGTLALGANVLRANGDADAYLVKLAASGALIYVLPLGGPEQDGAASLAVDAAGNAAISGPGIGTVKVDAQGNVVWATAFYGSVAFDSLGNTLVAGELTGTADFGGDPLSSAGGADIFVAKLSPSGAHLFSRRFGDAAKEQRAQAIAVDGANNLLIAGVFEGKIDFGDGALSLPDGACPNEAWCRTAGFIAKFDPLGQTLWSISSGPTRALSGLTVDSQSNVLASGALPGDVTPFSIPLLTKLNAEGDTLWRRSEWPATGIGAGHSLALDVCDDVLWSVSALPSLGADERPYLAKLSQ